MTVTPEARRTLDEAFAKFAEERHHTTARHHYQQMLTDLAGELDGAA